MISCRILPLGVRASLALALLAAPALTAQAPARTTGRIVGRVIDAASGQGISDAGVQVVGTTTGTMSGLEGRFSLAGVPAGTVTIQVRRIGYAPKTVTGLMLAGGETLEQNISLSSAAVSLSAQVVTAAAERGTVSEALDQQRTATGIVNSVTREQIARSPDSDAAQAVQRVSGVTVQDGRYVFVRGLGERYTTTSLNGARLPSPEPERKVVPLDLFPSGLLQSVTTTKTFTPDLPGDFSGAQVDIRTREFPAQRQFAYSLTVGANTNAVGTDGPYSPGVGGEPFALAGAERNLPSILRATDFSAGLPQAQENALIRSFRPVWDVSRRSGAPNTSFSASVGGSDPVLGQRIGYLLSGTYSYGQDVKNQARRGLALGAGGAEINRFEGDASGMTALLGGMANFSTLIGMRNRVSFNNTYNRTSDHTASVERGQFEDLGNLPAEIQVLNYVERSIRSSQLLGEHDYGRHRVEWSANSSGVTRDQPDRSEFIREIVPATDATPERRLWLSALPEGAVRTFATLEEGTLEGRLDYTLQLGAIDSPLRLKAGGLVRDTDRRADVRAFGILGAGLDEAQRAQPAEQIFAQLAAGDQAALELRPLAQGGAYDAADRNLSGYLMADAPITERLRFIGGARVEDSRVSVSAVSTIGDEAVMERRFTDVLPSAALNFRPTESQNVRLSVSRTLARPEYRELAALRTRDVLGGVDVRGNPDLVRTRIDNADLRWEWYPNAGEIVSAAVFAKRFDDPIERVFRPTSSGNSVVTFVNADGADNYGVELELRKNLGFVAEVFEPFTAFTNLTFMRSQVQLGDNEGTATTKERAMVGQAPYVLNGGVSYAGADGRLSATVLYNRVGRRIAEAGEASLADVYDQPRDVLDVSLRFPLLRSLSGRFDARNLFDAPYERLQGTVVRERYLAGRIFQAGVSWQR